MLSRPLRRGGLRVISRYRLAALSITSIGVLAIWHNASAQGGAESSATTPQPGSTAPQPTSSEGTLSFGARLSGVEETPSIFTPANGTFDGAIDLANQDLTYTLTYTGLSAPVTVAHIHFAKEDVAGGIVAFLCGGGNKPACPQSGPVTGTIVAGDILALDAQGVPAGSFQALFLAIVSGSAYANVHTSAHTAGEIRGQIRF
jgi:hypothetical protein